MAVNGPGRFERALRAVMALLDALPGPTMLIGGIAVIAHGHVRTTDDIAATVSGKDVTAEQILAVAAGHDIESRIDDPVAFARRNQVLLLVHRPTGVPVDVSLAWLAFEEAAFGRQCGSSPGTFVCVSAILKTSSCTRSSRHAPSTWRMPVSLRCATPGVSIVNGSGAPSASSMKRWTTADRGSNCGARLSAQRFRRGSRVP